MSKCHIQLILISTLVPLMATCANSQAKEPNLGSQEKSLNSEMSIAWLGNGARILVDGQWLYDVQGKSFKHINFLMPSSGNSISSAQFFSRPNGYSVFRYDGRDQLYIYDIQRENSVGVKIPNWVSGGSEIQEDNTINNVPVWLDEKTLYVHQFYKQSPDKFACSVYSMNTASWKELDSKDCLGSSFFYISEITSLGNGLVATLSSAEGQQSLDLFQVYLKGERLVQKLVAKLDINAVVPTQIQRKSKNSYDLVVPCVLKGKNALECVP